MNSAQPVNKTVNKESRIVFMNSAHIYNPKKAPGRPLDPPEANRMYLLLS